ncbi:Rhodanese-like domain-containing protein [Trichoderma barbatum]
MATRQACQRLLLLRRISPRGIASASVSISACAARACSTAAVRSAAAKWTTPRGAAGRGVRWYSGPENTVPGSRIWGFDEIKALVEGKEPKEKVVIVDVREPHELLDTGKIPGAINIPITTGVQSFHVSDEDFEDMYGYARPPKDAALLFYCKAGVRARAAAGLAQHAGWASVGEYPGSWLDWDMRKGPVEVVKPGSKGGEGK